MIPRFELHPERHIGAQHSRQNLLRGLDQALCPACLLRLERRHLNRKFGRAFHVLQIFELPALELATVGEVGVLSERVVLPSSRILNRLPPPHTRGAVKVEEHMTARASAVFENEMPVQQDCFNIRKE